MSIRSFIQSFRDSKRGSVAPIFALAIIPTIGLTGMAVDYSRANSVKVAVQSALDATALALAKSAATLSQQTTPTGANALQDTADKYFRALIDHPEATIDPITATYTTNSGTQLLLTATGHVPTAFTKFMGFDQLDVGSSATIKWGNTRLRVALVLDNTGSMNDAGKIDALKTATNALLTQLKNAATVKEDVYISIIPFVKDVNLGSSNYNSNWIYWGTQAQDSALSDNTSWDANNGSCSRGSAFTNRGNCLAYPICSKTQFTTQTQCQNKNGTWYTTAGTWTPNAHSTWNGCAIDRGYPASPSTLNGNSGPDTTYNFDTNAVSPDTTKPSSLLAAEQYGSCPQAVLPLGSPLVSSDWTNMTTLVNNMVAAGNTNQAIGLMHGWMSLVGGGPYPAPPATDTNYIYNTVIILLTDGLNTQDRWYTDQTSIDDREQLTCNNINAAKITLYTIQVNTGGDPTSILLQNCAGSPGKYPDSAKNFVVTASSGIGTVFNQIGTQLSQLRIAK